MLTNDQRDIYSLKFLFIFFLFLLYETNVCRCSMNKQHHPFFSKTGIQQPCLIKKRDPSCPTTTSPDSQSDSYFLYLKFIKCISRQHNHFD